MVTRLQSLVVQELNPFHASTCVETYYHVLIFAKTRVVCANFKADVRLVQSGLKRHVWIANVIIYEHAVISMQFVPIRAYLNMHVVILAVENAENANKPSNTRLVMFHVTNYLFVDVVAMVDTIAVKKDVHHAPNHVNMLANMPNVKRSVMKCASCVVNHAKHVVTAKRAPYVLWNVVKFVILNHAISHANKYSSAIMYVLVYVVNHVHHAKFVICKSGNVQYCLLLLTRWKIMNHYTNCLANV